MKAAANGVVNLSVLDGWWDEGWTGDNGWAIGGRETNPDEGAQDWADAQDLYRILEQELIPAYYERDADGLPRSLDAAHAQLHRQHDLALLDDPHAPRVRGAPVPPRRPARRRARGRGHAASTCTGDHRRTRARSPSAAYRGRTVAPRISLALAIHNHQPVGNFGWVFAEVYDRAYLPMLEALERHPGVRLSLHYTGPAARVAGRRAPGVPAAARLRWSRAARWSSWAAACTSRSWRRSRSTTGSTSSTRMAATLEGITGRRPRGAWLAERVWEPDLPTSLAAAGYRWTILDDAHFRAAAIPEENLWGAYTTEDQGNLLTVFGTEQGLRYRIPFGAVEDVIDYLRDHATEAGDRVGMMGDDGEKFGAWPTTYEHCWGERRWVERFFEALEANADWLTTVTPSQWLDREPPIGRVYVPTSSYAEMGEWALPPDETVVFAQLLHEAVAEHRPEARWLRGGFWRNFQVKYREINDLHKQMLRTSAKVAAMPDGPGAGRRHGPPPPRPVERLLLARPVRRHLHLAHAPGHVRAPDRRRGCRRRARSGWPRRGGAAGPGHGRPARGVPRRARPGRDRQAVRGRRHRQLGHPGRAPRAGRGAAPPAGGLPRRRSAPTRPGRR